MTNLFIAEKPELARAIASAINGTQSKGEGFIKVGDNIITWCFGHLLQLKDPHEYDEKYKKWNINDLPFNISKLELKPSKDKVKQVNIIKKLLKDADIIINAGDPDEEGQLLVDEVLEYLGNKKPVKRILINDNTPASVKKSLANLKNNNDFQGLRNSAYVRSIADWKYGLNLTRGYTLIANAGSVLSVGRVQTPVLNLIYNREMEVKNHVKQLYYNLFSHNNFKFDIPKDNLVDTLCVDKDYLFNIKQDCEANNDFIINDILIKKLTNHPPLPFNLLELQAESFRLFNYKPDQVKDITQTLREKHQAITYNRSDCQYLTNEHYKDKLSVIDSINHNLTDFNHYQLDTNLKHKAFNDKNVSAHHAIIPTTKKLNTTNFSQAELNLYTLIAKRYLLLFLPPEIVEQTSYIATNSTKLIFKATTNKILAKGFKEFTNEKLDETKDIKTELKYNYKKGDNANFTEFTMKESETKPKQLYTFATLLKDLTSIAKYIKDIKIKELLLKKDAEKKGESGGIGTPATRDTIIKTLIIRNFILEQKGKLVTTDLAKDFLNALPDIAKNPDMTALWAEKQAEIRANSLSVAQFLSEIDDFIQQEVNNLKTKKINISTVNTYTKSNFKHNTKTKYPKSEPKNIEQKISKIINKDIKCNKCNEGFMQQRTGKYGAFLGCSNYPNCKNIQKLSA